MIGAMMHPLTAVPGVLDGFSGDSTGGQALFGVLAVLALVDSMSFGTLLIPVWLLMTPGRVRVARMLVFLGTIAVFYFTVGLLIMFGADAFLSRYGYILQSRVFLIGQLIVGILLFAFSFLLDSKKAKARAAERAANGGGRMNTWRIKVMGDTDTPEGSPAALMGLALIAALIEVASMLPYLAGIGIITTSGLSLPMSGLLLFGYCIVMIAPALILMVGRIVAARTLDRPLRKLDQWLTKNAASTTAWVIGIVGFLLAANAITDLGWVNTQGA